MADDRALGEDVVGGLGKRHPGPRLPLLDGAGDPQRTGERAGHPGGWQQVDFKNPAAVWSITTAQLLMFGGNATADDNEDWVISKGFNPWQIAPDAGVGLKNVSGVMNEYAYVYKNPGTYKVVFDASNVRYNGEKRLTREVTLTITP